MRPKKLVLVLEPNDNRLGILMFTLSVHGYAVVGCHTVLEADAIAKERVLDAVFMQTDLGLRLSGVPTVIANKRPMAEILLPLRLACSKKRGPRKGTLCRPQKPVAESFANLHNNPASIGGGVK